MNTISGVVSAVVFTPPFDEGGRVTLIVGECEPTLLTRDADTAICFEGETVRGSDLLGLLAEAPGPVSVILWPCDDKGGACVKAKFTTGA